MGRGIPLNGGRPQFIFEFIPGAFGLYSEKKKQNDDDDNFGESAYSSTKPRLRDSYLPILGGGLMTSGGGPCMTISGGGPTGQ